MNSRHTHRMTRGLPLLLAGIILTVVVSLSLTLTARTAAAASPSSHVDVMTLNSDIGPASLHSLTNAITTAESDGAQALVIQVDSPGGDIASMKSMVEAELNSTVPIISYVSPTGAYAASAAAFVTLVEERAGSLLVERHARGVDRDGEAQVGLPILRCRIGIGVRLRKLRQMIFPPFRQIECRSHDDAARIIPSRI